MDHYYHTFGLNRAKGSKFGHNFDYPFIYRKMVQLAPHDGHFVEIGSHIGGSSCFLAVEIINSGKNIKLDCIDPWNEDPDYGMDRFNEFTKNMKPVEGYYNAIRAYSPAAADQYQDQSLDFVWIDGDHWYDGVKADILGWLPKIKKNGWLGGHDCDKHGGDVEKVVHELLGDYISEGLVEFHSSEKFFKDSDTNTINHDYLDHYRKSFLVQITK